jgi:hypothetical protein
MNGFKYKKMKFKAPLTLLFILFSLTLFSQRVKISGYVTDFDGQPLELVSIQESGLANLCLTNEKGFFSMEISAGDSCTLVFSCLGYNRIKRVIPSPKNGMQLSVTMRHSSVELGAVTVVAQHIQTNTTERIKIEKSRLQTDASGGNIEAIVVMQGTGVSSSNELSSQYSVRGGNYDENIVYVNGTEVFRPLLIRSGQQEGLSFINPDLTKEVRFSSGGFEPKYGDKMSSVLDIVYKRPENLEGSAMLSMTGASAYVGSASGKFTQITGVRFKKNAFLLGTLDTKGEYDPSFVDLQTYMTYMFSAKLSWDFFGNFSNNSYRFTPVNRSTSYGTVAEAKNFTVYFDGRENDNFQGLFGASGFTYRLSEKTNLSLKFSLFQSREEEAYDISGEYWLSDIVSEEEKSVIGTGKYHEHARNRLISDIFNVTHSASHQIDRHALRWALTWQRERTRDRIREWEMRDSSGYSLPRGDERVNVIQNLYSKQNLASNRLSAYFQDTYKFRIEAGLFSVTAGLRGSYWDFNRELILSPRASIGFIPSFDQRITLRFATGLYYQSPFYKEFRTVDTDGDRNSYIVLNRNIRSQRSLHFVLGGDYSFRAIGRPFKFTAETYYKKLDKLVPYTVDNVKVRYYGSNMAFGYATGLDLKLFGEFVPETDSWLNFSLMKAQQHFAGKNVPLPTDQRYNISLFFTDYFPRYERIRLNLRAIWSDGLPASAPGKGYEYGYFTTPSYRRIDIGMSYQFSADTDNFMRSGFFRYLKNIYLGLDCFNLFDINNVNSYYWVTDVNNIQYAVPNFLTGRQLSAKVLVEF